jgi:hypothetical protein
VAFGGGALALILGQEGLGLVKIRTDNLIIICAAFGATVGLFVGIAVVAEMKKQER